MAKNITASLADDLASVFPETKTLVINGRTIEIAPFKFKVLLKVLQHVNNLFTDLGYFDQYSILQTLLKGVSEHPEDLIGILKLSTGITDEAFYEEITSADGVDLIIATWEVNKDFFSQRLGTKLKNLFPSQEEVR